MRCEKLAKLYEPKAWAFLRGLGCFKRIYRVRRFDGLKQNGQNILDYSCANVTEACFNISTICLRPSSCDEDQQIFYSCTSK